MNHNIVIISFSSRKLGNCEQISEFLSNQADSVKLYRFSDFQIQPCGACHYECFQTGSACPYADDMERELLDAICRSQQVYFVLPNYQDYPCANFFVFQERMQGYFNKNPGQRNAFRQVSKRFMIVSNTRADHMKTIAAQYGAAEEDILVLKSRAFGLSAIKDRIIESDEVRRLIREFAVRGA